ncbi:TetR/AcrR family transcriptional regulator [Ornithinimicrobium faecis]|uniref:TetR/AcrR family transcriptional regulator n=1 Tax=Ornithinimicrobium faecis TaxID=2934158 RepID=A0ABY4YSD7_9MICO|nr:TetR/AcrR family transcriptional regulator [Ornithinimicrobium sp. HY1793]USQ79674.1 TetR/AcrR family transcriptional regulator [Ornithinimicrobium sp. HY1793]
MVDRRHQIVQAAQAVIAQEGLGALSVRTTAARAGIGASTLRHYFPTQQALFDAVVSDSFNAQLDDLRIADTHVPAADRLLECLAQFLPPSDDEIAQLLNWLAMYTAALGPDRTEQGARALISLTELGRQRVVAWLEVLGDQGELRHLDMARHAAVLLTHLDGLCLALLAPDSGPSVPDALEQLRDLIAAMVVR